MCLLCNCKTFWKYGGTTIFKYSFTIFIYQINYQAQFNWNYHCYLLRASHILAFIDTSYHPILTATLLQLGTKVNCLTHSFIHSSYFKMFELLICARPFSAWIPALMELRIQRRRQLINDHSIICMFAAEKVRRRTREVWPSQRVRKKVSWEKDNRDLKDK